MGSVASRPSAGSGERYAARLLTGIEEADTEKVAKAIKKGADIQRCTLPGRPPSREPRIPTFASLSPPSWSALMHACSLGHVPVVQLLLQQGAAVGVRALDGTTALMVASREGHVLVVAELLRHFGARAQPALPPPVPAPAGPDCALADPLLVQDDTPISSFVTGEPLPTAALRSAGAFDPLLDAVDARGETALLKAAALGYAPIVELLVYAGANVCVADRVSGMTALAWAAESGPSEIVRMLLQAGANIARKNHNGQTALHCAASKPYTYGPTEEDDDDADANGRDATDEDDMDHASVLAEETRRAEHSRSLAGAASTPSVASSSFAAAARVAAPSTTARSLWCAPAASASGSSPTGVVLTLLQHGADRDASNHDRYTPLMVAAWRGHAAVVELLLAFRARRDARAETGQTALMLAASRRRSRCAEVLIRGGADVDLADERGERALHKAAAAGDRFTATCLLDAHAEVDAREHVRGDAPMHLAARHARASGVVTLLLARGAQVDPRNHRAETPLMAAASRALAYTVGVLLRGGADPTAADARGQTPLVLAARVGSGAVVELLIAAGARATTEAMRAAIAGSITASAVGPPAAHARVVELLIAAGAPEPSEESLRHPSLRDAVARGRATRELHQKQSAAPLAITDDKEAAQLAPANGQDASSPRITPVPAQRASSDPIPPIASSNDHPSLVSSLPIRLWHVPHVLSWLASFGFSEHASSFSDAGVDGEALLDLARAPSNETDHALARDLRVTRPMHRMRLRRELAELVIRAKAEDEEQLRQQQQQQQQPPVSRQESLQPLRPAAASTTTTGMAVNSGTPASPSAKAGSAASNVAPDDVHPLLTHVTSTSSSSSAPIVSPSPSCGVVLAPTSSLAPLSGPPSILAPALGGIFSAGFDFSDLSGLAPLAGGSGGSNASNGSIVSNGSNGSGGLALPPSASLAASPLAAPMSHHAWNPPAAAAASTEYVNFSLADLVPSSTPLTSQSRTSTTGSDSLRPINAPVLAPATSSSTATAPVTTSSVGVRRIPHSELRFGEVIGSGQFGTVYLGTWRGVAVAIKRLRLGPNDARAQLAPEQVQAFLREAALMGLLGAHPNLIALVGVCVPEEVTMAPTTNGVAASAVPNGVDSSIAHDVCIVTQYFPLGSVRDLLVTRRTLDKAPLGVLAAVVARDAGVSLGTVIAAASESPASLLPLPLPTLLRMCRDIARGVVHLHLERVAHRDLAARNCLVDEFSLAVRVADFGLARALRPQRKEAGSGGGDEVEADDASYTHSHVGPLKHMAPECVVHSAYSGASDAFAFGITAWEILWSGADPYPGLRPLEAAVAASRDATVRPQLPPDCPQPIARLLRDCWQHLPSARPSFARILARLDHMESFLARRVAEWASSTAAPEPSPSLAAARAFAWSPACWQTYTREPDEEEPHHDGPNAAMPPVHETHSIIEAHSMAMHTATA